MKRLIAITLLCLCPVSLLAQSVTVRSGDHGSFTRLVFTIPVGMEWNLTPDHSARKLSVTFGSDQLTFDTSGVFDRIGTDRIAGLAPARDGGGLDIALACHCDAEAFVLGGRMLVIDVAASDRPPEAVKAGQSPKGPGPADSWKTGLVDDFTEVRIGAFPGLGPEPVRVSGLPLLPGRAEVASTMRSPAELAESDSMQPDSLSGRIAADLAVAASVGLLDPAVRPLPKLAPQRQSQDTGPPPGTSEPPEPGSLAHQLATGLSTLDHRTPQTGRIAVGSDRCLPADAVTLSQWVDAGDAPSNTLAERRGAVFGEFDRINEEAVQDYARALVHFGFGAEARAILALVDGTSDKTLVALSFLVDGDGDPERVFPGQSDCESAAALWAALSAKQRSDIARLNEAALLRSFEALPKHLRGFLGPGLADQLSSFGYPDTASEVLRRLQRMEGRETDEIALGKAQMALKEGDLDAASRRIQDLSVNGGAEAARAVAMAVDLADAAESRVPQRIVDLSEAFATELRNSDDGQLLWEAHVRSQLVNRNFDEAFADMRAARNITEDVVNAAWQTGLTALVERADDVTFLRLSTKSIRDGVLPEEESLAVAFARRLNALGLPQVSLDLLAPLAEPGSPSDIRIARAEALLSLGRPEEAEIILIGQRGDAVARLRAEARKQMGDHAFSKGLFARLGDQDKALHAAWLSGDWDDVALTDSVYAPAAILMVEESADPDLVSQGLGSLTALSEDSADTRATLRALLDATAIPSD